MNGLTKDKTLTSLEICEMIGKSHSHLCRDIGRYVEVLTQTKNGFSEYFKKSSYKDSTGKKNIMWLCSKKGCDLIAHKMTGEKGIRFTAAYIDRFYDMEATLEARAQGKGVRREFTDAIKEFVELAESQGHYGTAKFAYSNFSKLIKKPFGVREGAEAVQLAMIAATEHILGCTIYAMVRTGADAKDIYNNVSTKAKTLTGVMLPALEA
jgi:Rha family phage regulatory protein